jgi:hypothetical protein
MKGTIATLCWVLTLFSLVLFGCVCQNVKFSEVADLTKQQPDGSEEEIPNCFALKLFCVKTVKCFFFFFFFLSFIVQWVSVYEYSAVSRRFLKRTATDWAETGLMASDHALRRRPIGYLTKCWSCKMICDLFYWLSTGKWVVGRQLSINALAEWWTGIKSSPVSSPTRNSKRNNKNGSSNRTSEKRSLHTPAHSPYPYTHDLDYYCCCLASTQKMDK